MDLARTNVDVSSLWPTILATERQRLSIPAGQWRHDVTQHGKGELDILIARVHASHDEEMVWVFGHAPSCARPGEGCAGPWCQQALVSVAGLLAAAGATG